MTTVRLTVGQALTRFLGVQYSVFDGRRQRLVPGVWAIFGHGNVAGFGQALQEYGPSAGLRVWRAQNEQGMVHAAAAFSRHADRLQVHACTASIGPGSLNMLTAAAGATINRVPVLLFPSDYFAGRSADPLLQQLEIPGSHDLTVNEAFKPVSRFYARIERPEQLVPALMAGFRVLTDPAETGAVTISLPEDVQSEAWDWPQELFAERDWHVRRPPPEADVLEEAVRLLAAASRPLIIAGGGVRYAAAESRLAALANEFGIPVVETQAGKGSLPWNHPMNAGPVGANGGSAANDLASRADVVLAVGTRLGDFVTGSRTAFGGEGVRFIGLNVAPFDAFKLDGLPLVADASLGLAAIAEGLRSAGTGWTDDYALEVSGLRVEWTATVTELISVKQPDDMAQSEVIGMVNEAFGGRATMICAAGSMPGDLLKLWRPEDPRAYHVEYGFSCMGYEVAAALGVKLAEPDREVVVMVGDGSYNMLNSEIITAVAEGLDFTVILVDNNGYQSIHGLQQSVGVPGFALELRYRNPATGELDGDYVPIDYPAHARSMGANAMFAPSEAALLGALERARGSRGVNVIVVPVNPEKRVPNFGGWWDVPPAEVSQQTGVQAARRAWEQGRKQQKEFL